MTSKTIYRTALKTWGFNAQAIMTIEECSELIKALTKFFRNFERENVLEEIADVEIMLEQLREHFGNRVINKIKKEKLERLTRRLNEHQ